MPGQRFTTIAQSGFVSDAFNLRSTELAGIWAPTVTSCQLFLQAAQGATADVPVSADFLRTWKPDGSAVFAWALGAGSAFLPAKDQLSGAIWARIEVDIAQDAARTFAVLTKER